MAVGSGGTAPLESIARYSVMLHRGTVPGEDAADRYVRAAERYLEFREGMAVVAGEEQLAALKSTVAGRLGRALEFVTRPLGFDYRINMALVGGFAAKEVVVSTLGTAYSLGDVGPEASGSLSERLASDPAGTRCSPSPSSCSPCSMSPVS